MAGIVERLTEGIVNRDMRAEGHALLEKWQRTGLLEGLDSDRKKGSMARLLENQAKELLRESSTMQAGDVEGFAAVAFPIVRRVFAGLIANDLVSVQPMSLPSGLIFFLDFVFSPNIGASGTMTDRLNGTADKSIYGTYQVGSQVTGGVDLVGSVKQDLQGPRTVGARGYAYCSPTGSLVKQKNVYRLEAATLAATTETQKKKYLLYDPDILALSSSDDAASYAWAVIGIPGNLLTASNGTVQTLTTSELSASRAVWVLLTLVSELVLALVRFAVSLSRLVHLSRAMSISSCSVHRVPQVLCLQSFKLLQQYPVL